MEAELELRLVLEMGKDVLPGDGETLLEEIGDGQRPEVEDLDGSERVEAVSRSDDQEIPNRDPVGEPRKGSKGDREPGLLGRRLEQVRVLR